MDPQIATVERYFGGLLPWAYEDARWTRAVDGDRLNAFRPVAANDVPSTPTWQYWPGSASAITYNKTALWLHTLEQMLGWETMQRLMQTYLERHAFQHPGPEEFFRVANEVAGRDLTWFFDQVYRSNVTFDYAVTGMTAHDAVVRRVGAGTFPVEVKATYADGSTETRTWDGRGAWTRMAFDGTRTLKSVEVDPNRVLLLDLNRTNNSYTSSPQASLAAKRWSLRWMTWMEELLLSYGFFA
jgi:hypothetical protein